MNVLILELKMYCGPDKFYGRSKFGQYDEVKNRAPFYRMTDRNIICITILKTLGSLQTSQLKGMMTERLESKEGSFPFLSFGIRLRLTYHSILYY